MMKESSEKRYFLPDCERFSLSGKAIDKLIRRGDAGAALLYLYLLRHNGRVDRADIFRALRMNEKDTSVAFASLSAIGLVAGERDAKNHDPPQETSAPLPQHSAADIAQNRENDPLFSNLLQDIGQVLGKILTTADMGILLGLYHDLKLPPEVIYQLSIHLKEEAEKKRGKGRVPSLRGIQEIAYLWAKDGIVTLPLALERIEARRKRASLSGQIKHILELRQDDLTDSQKRYIHSWLDMGFMPEVIAEAYDRTLVGAGKFSWTYIHRILSNWSEKGLLTLTDIAQGDPKKDPFVTKPVEKTDRKQAQKKQSEQVPTREEIDRLRRLADRL